MPPGQRLRAWLPTPLQIPSGICAPACRPSQPPAVALTALSAAGLVGSGACIWQRLEPRQSRRDDSGGRRLWQRRRWQQPAALERPGAAQRPTHAAAGAAAAHQRHHSGPGARRRRHRWRQQRVRQRLAGLHRVRNELLRQPPVRHHEVASTNDLCAPLAHVSSAFGGRGAGEDSVDCAVRSWQRGPKSST